MQKSSVPAHRYWYGTLSSLAHSPTSGRLRMSRITLPVKKLAITAHTRSGRSLKRNGPGVSPLMMKAPIRMAMVGELGTPSTSSGIIEALA